MEELSLMEGDGGVMLIKPTRSGFSSRRTSAPIICSRDVDSASKARKPSIMSKTRNKFFL